MLGVGIDWAEEFHLVALGRPGEGVIDVARVEHDPRSLDALIARLVALEPDPAEVRVVLETSSGMLVERLVEAGFTVVPVNPDLIARRRGPARKKDDAGDARIACWRWTASSGSDRWWPTATRRPSCGPSLVMTNELSVTSDGC